MPDQALTIRAQNALKTAQLAEAKAQKARLAAKAAKKQYKAARQAAKAAKKAARKARRQVEALLSVNKLQPAPVKSPRKKTLVAKAPPRTVKPVKPARPTKAIRRAPGLLPPIPETSPQTNPAGASIPQMAPMVPGNDQ